MKILITILILLICSGCQSRMNTARDIAREPYHITDNNCMHKAKKYKAQWGGIIWVVRKNGHHAMVKHADGWWFDPTAGTWCRPIKDATALYPYVED